MSSLRLLLEGFPALAFRLHFSSIEVRNLHLSVLQNSCYLASFSTHNNLLSKSFETARRLGVFVAS